jgi:hypothetical protein
MYACNLILKPHDNRMIVIAMHTLCMHACMPTQMTTPSLFY